MKHIHTYEEFLNESHLWNPSMKELVYGRGGIGTDQESLEYLWKISKSLLGSTSPHFFEEPNEETNKSKKEELLKRLGLTADAHQKEKEALRTGEYFLEMWRKEKNMKYDKKAVFESFLNEFGPLAGSGNVDQLETIKRDAMKKSESGKTVYVVGGKNGTYKVSNYFEKGNTYAAYYNGMPQVVERELVNEGHRPAQVKIPANASTVIKKIQKENPFKRGKEISDMIEANWSDIIETSKGTGTQRIFREELSKKEYVIDLCKKLNLDDFYFVGQIMTNYF